MKRHILPYHVNKVSDLITWLSDNVHKNFHDDGSKYNSSSVSQFVEWRSKDHESWILRIAGNPPRIYVEIKDEEMEVLFLLRWG